MAQNELGAKIRSFFNWGSPEPTPPLGLTGGSLSFNNPQPIFQEHLISMAVRDRAGVCEVSIEDIEVSSADLETFSRALERSRQSGIAETVAIEHLRSGHPKYQARIRTGTATFRRHEIDERIRAIYPPDAAIVYRFGENTLSAFVVHSPKQPDQLAA